MACENLKGIRKVMFRAITCIIDTRNKLYLLSFLVFENSILLIRVQGYRGLTEKLKTVKTVHTLRYSVKTSEYFRWCCLL